MDDTDRPPAAPDPRQREVLRAATTSLQDAIAAFRGNELAERVAALLPEVQQALTEHSRLAASPRGLHDAVVEADPRLKHTADALLDEHRELSARVAALRGQMVSVATAAGRSAQDAAQVRRAAEDLVRRLNRHMERGSTLLYEAFERDIGAGD